MEKVSIVVPVYNVEQYLKECIESILNQTYPNFEIILVDDGSTDQSGNICDEYSAKDERIVVVHKINKGLSSARNRGIEVSRGKYIIFADSDDYWIGNDSLEHLVNSAEKFKADVVRGEYVSVNDNGEQIRTITKSKIGFELQLLTSAEFYKNAIAGENFSVLFLFRKDALGTLRFDENLNIQEDIDFNIKFFAIERRCIYSPKVFYVYRKRANSITTLPKLPHLVDSFYICEVFENLSFITELPEIKVEYRKQSILKYLRVLSSMTEEPYYSNVREICKAIGLKSIYLKTLKRMLKYRMFNCQTISVLLPPTIYIKVLHIKIAGYNFLYKNRISN